MESIFQLKFRTKIILLGLFGVILTAAALFAVVSWQSSQYTRAAQIQVESVTETNLENIVLSTYNLIEAQGESVQQQVRNNLKLAGYVLQAQQGMDTRSETVEWAVINQESRRQSRIRMPRMLVGGVLLERNSEFGVRTPLVDEIVEMVGGTATVFQRMNEAGDMLRVATNVKTAEGKRAVGYYIPAAFSNGKENPVISTILEGSEYHGLAYVLDAWYLTAYAPLKDQSGEISGMYYVGVRQENIQSLRHAIRNTRVGASGSVMILNGQSDLRGSLVISPSGEKDGQSLWNIQDSRGSFVYQEMVAAAATLGAREISRYRYLWKEPGEETPRWKVAQIAYYQPWEWVIVAEVYEDELQEYLLTLQEGRSRMLAVIAGLGVAIAVVVVIFGFPLIQTALRPLLHLTEVAERISAGNLETTANVKGNDEIAHLAHAFNSMTTRLRQSLQDEQAQHQRLKTVITGYVEHMARVAQGSLAGRINLGSNGVNQDDPLEVLGKQLNETTASLQGMILQTQQGAQKLNEAAREILSDSRERAAGAAEQFSAITQISTTVEQVRLVVRQAGDSADQVKSVSLHTLDVSKEGREAVKNTIESMERIKLQVEGIAENILALSEQMNQIGEIIHTVDELASRSNLLALNASIEASRAGSHGKGFTVVAQEVRSLAEQSKKATAQIAEILNKIQQSANKTVFATEEGAKSVDEGVILAEKARQSIDLLSSVIDGSTQMAHMIVAGSKQQLSGIEQIAAAVHSVNQVTQQSLESTRQAENSARRLAELATRMTETVTRYEL